MQQEIDALLRAWSQEIATEAELARAIASILNRAAGRRQEMIAEITRAIAGLRGDQPAANDELERITRLARQMESYRGHMQ